MKYKNIVWDWNGTLLDDVEVGVNTLNDMLKRRGMSPFSKEEYKERFGFPVADFYREVGFDFQQESMHELSIDFVNTYDKYTDHLQLNLQVAEVLTGLRQTGVRQYVLSALREDLLQQMLCDFKIDFCFERVCGSNDIYANGKVERGQQMLKNNDLHPGETLLVGDTVHDAEVAKALGFDCVLFTGGHNSERRLREKAPVIHRIKEVMTL